MASLPRCDGHVKAMKVDGLMKNPFTAGGNQTLPMFHRIAWRSDCGHQRLSAVSKMD